MSSAVAVIVIVIGVMLGTTSLVVIAMGGTHVSAPFVFLCGLALVVVGVFALFIVHDSR